MSEEEKDRKNENGAAKGLGRRDCLKLAPVTAAGLWLSSSGGREAQAAGPAGAGGIFGGKDLSSHEGMSVVLLGTGSPLPNPERACSSTLVIAGDKTFLVDTGRGFLTNLEDFGLSDVSMVLFTHYHSDHVGEFGELMVNKTIRGSKTSLPVIGPRGARQVVDGLLSAYELDNKYRKDHHKDKWNEKGMEVKVRENSPGVVYDEGGVKITMFEVDHSPVKPAMGYRFDYKGKSVVVSGDTRRVPQMTEMAKDCDVLVHEAVNKTLIKRAQKIGGNLVDLSERMWKMTLEMMDYHTSTEEVAEIARDANVKKLVLTHMVPAPATNLAGEALFISGMRKIYKGPIKVGRDGMEIKA